VLINRILIVGLGSIGKRHLRLARKLMPTADIRVLRHQPSNEIPDHSNGCFSSIDDAIFFAPQIAVIANPASFHIPIAKKLAEVGVNLLVEKPLSNNLDGVAELIEICQTNDNCLLTGFNLRYLPSLQHFRNLLDEGIIGKVLSVRCEVGQYLPSWRSNVEYQKGVSAQHNLGGGALLELSHEIDYLRWIFGEIEWVKASMSKQSSLKIDVEDTVHIIMSFMPKTSKHKLVAAVSLDFIRHDTTRLCKAIGENGSLCWNGITGEVSLYESGEKEWRQIYSYKHKPDESYLAEWEDLIFCVKENKIPLVVGEDGLKALQIIEAINKSSNSKGQLLDIGFSSPNMGLK
jgi:predicted dehydrogenase